MIIIITIIIVYFANKEANHIIKSKLKYKKIHAHIDRNTIKHPINIKSQQRQYRGSKTIPYARFDQCTPIVRVDIVF